MNIYQEKGKAAVVGERPSFLQWELAGDAETLVAGLRENWTPELKETRTVYFETTGSRCSSVQEMCHFFLFVQELFPQATPHFAYIRDHSLNAGEYLARLFLAAD